MNESKELSELLDIDKERLEKISKIKLYCSVYECGMCDGNCIRNGCCLTEITLRGTINE